MLSLKQKFCELRILLNIKDKFVVGSCGYIHHMISLLKWEIGCEISAVQGVRMPALLV